MIEKPLLAADFDPNKAQFPYWVTPKIDGIRFIIKDGKALSRSLKPIKNNHIRGLLEKYLPEGTDGEITVGHNFQTSTSAIMTIKGEPNFKVWIFDLYSTEPYLERTHKMFWRFANLTTPFEIKMLYPQIVNNIDEALFHKEKFMEDGYEGMMLRSGSGRYKFGRSTLKENILLKWKDFIDDEREIIGFEERMHNSNPQTTNELGRSERSSNKAGMIPMDTLGALILNYNNAQLSVGTGFSDEQRQMIWDNRQEYMGKLAKFKYMAYGVKDLPRHPVFLGFRDESDQ